MADLQLVTLVLTLVTIFAASWWNNARLNHLKEVLRAEMDLRFTKLEHRLERMDENISRVLADTNRASQS